MAPLTLTQKHWKAELSSFPCSDIGSKLCYLHHPRKDNMAIDCWLLPSATGIAGEGAGTLDSICELLKAKSKSKHLVQQVVEHLSMGTAGYWTYHRAFPRYCSGMWRLLESNRIHYGYFAHLTSLSYMTCHCWLRKIFTYVLKPIVTLWVEFPHWPILPF